ncbi:MAG: hypothetical protein M3N18_13850 [Actinomycetota bacterium]|nr:hypothetical protein [Actinomycetota bacterium]
MGRDRDRDEGRPVEPGEAQAHGNDPDAVEINREGGRDAGRLGPNIDAEGRDMDNPQGGEGPRSVRRAQEDRQERSRDEGRGRQDAQRRGDADRNTDSERGTSWTSVIFGLLAALGASLILSGIVGGIVAAILGALGGGGGAEGGTAGLIGVLLTLLLAFLIGGYVAGRLASRSGVKHGLLVPLLLLVLTILLAIIGALVGFSLIDNLQGVTLPAVPGGVQQQAQGEAPQNLGAILTVSGILALLVPFIGGALGGAWGAKTGRNRP